MGQHHLANCILKGDQNIVDEFAIHGMTLSAYQKGFKVCAREVG